MEWVNKIKDIDFSGNKYSQEGEEAIAAFIFSHIGVTNKFFVDLGAGGYSSVGKKPNYMSNTRKFMEDGWTGLMIDKAARGVPDIKEYHLTPENVCEILEKENCPKEFDFLSVDIDSFDFYILDKVLKFFSPRVICTEFNSALPPEESLVLKYEEDYSFNNTSKYGYSFAAGVKLFEKHNYILVYNHLNLDLFAVRSDVMNANFGGNPHGITAKRVVNFPISKDAVWETY